VEEIEFEYLQHVQRIFPTAAGEILDRVVQRARSSSRCIRSEAQAPADMFRCRLALAARRTSIRRLVSGQAVTGVRARYRGLLDGSGREAAA